MKRKFASLIMAAIFVMTIYVPVFAAVGGGASEGKYLNIATTDNGPLSIDRLLYVALRSMNCDVTFTCPVVAEGFSSANEGTRDAVIAAFPDLDSIYTNLRRVPVPLERINVMVFARHDRIFRFDIDSWDDLSGLKVGILDNRTYILEMLPENVNITVKETSKAVLDGLSQNEYDVAVLVERTHETLSESSNVRRVGQVDQLTEYLYLNKAHEELVPVLADTLQGMFDDGRADQILNDIPIPEINQKKTILHIASSTNEITREDQFNAVMMKQFENDMSVEWYSVSLNVRRFSRDPNRLSSIAGLLRQDCVSRNIAAIIVSGDDALSFLTTYYYLYFRNVPVLFYSVGDTYKEIIRDYGDCFTGILESIGAAQTVEAALELFPDTERIYVVNDYTTEGLRYRNAMERQLAPFEGRVGIEYNDDISYNELMERIGNLPAQSLVFFGSYYVDSNGQYYSHNETKRLLERECGVPILSLYSTAAEYGAVGGYCLDYEAYGDVISGMLDAVLSGSGIERLPVVEDSQSYNRWIFDKNQLDRFGISQDMLPVGAQVINAVPSVWESNPRFATAVLILMVVSVAIIVAASMFILNRRKLREQRISDEKIREVKERLERIINTAPIYFMISVGGKVVELNDSMKNDTGLNVGDDVVKIHTFPEHRDRMLEVLNRGKQINGEIVTLKLANGESHRCITNVATIEYEKQSAVAVWAVDAEKNERYKDELIASQREIREVEERLEWIIRNSSVGYMLVIDGKVVEINENLKQSLGLSVGALLSQVQGSELPGSLIDRMLRRHEVNNEVMVVNYVNGERRRCLVNLATFRHNRKRATVAWVVDIEQSERQKDQLRTARQNIQMILDMLPVAIRVMDNETKEVNYANRAAAKMFGLSDPTLALGVSYKNFVAEYQPDGGAGLEKISSPNLTSEPVSAEVVMKKPNGELFDTLVTACLIDYDGRLSSLGIMQDLTAEKEYQRMLASTAEKEREANSLKGRFLVNMSHEIRTPMNAIIGLTEIELHRESAEQARGVYKKINTSAKNLLAIINDILDLSKIEADKIELFEDEFELEDVLNSALMVTTPRLEGKNVEFLLNGSLDLPRYIVGDRTRLWQILKNFLDNSAKFTDSGKIVLNVATVPELSDGDTVTVSFIIEDTGLGMDDEQMERVFMPYHQIYNDAQKRYTGTGLGMSISKQLCEIMGGKMSIESELGKGTTVRISIPFRRSAQSGAEQWAAITPVLEGFRVLAVDDDRLSLDIMKRLITNGGAGYVCAQSGIEALEIIKQNRRDGEDFDLILLDYMMEGWNGLETAQRIQQELADAPKLLMVTAYQELLLKDELENSGIDGVIEKPFIPSQFVGKLCSILGVESGLHTESKVKFSKFRDVRVLLCEDYHMNQEVATGILSQFGVETVVAENGKEGVDLLMGGNEYDMVFMDLQMPVMDGYEATRILRADPRFDGVPIVGLTADAMKEVVDECLKIGMNDHLAKPIEYEALYKVLLKWLPASKLDGENEASIPTGERLNAALAYFGGDEGRYRDALAEFARLLPDPGKWQSYAVAIRDKDITDRYVHKLKGAAGTLSETEIFKYATDFESALRAGEPAEKLYNLLISACNAAKLRIIGQMAENSADDAQRESGTAGELSALLEDLKPALMNYDPDAIDPVIESIRGKAWPDSDERMLEEVFSLVKRFDYGAALELLDSVLPV